MSQFLILILTEHPPPSPVAGLVEKRTEQYEQTVKMEKG
jgi:hypothetical protein